MQINIDDITVEASYAGPRLDKSTDEIDGEWCKTLMKHQKDQKTLHKKYVCMLIRKCQELFEKEASLVDV